MSARPAVRFAVERFRGALHGTPLIFALNRHRLRAVTRWGQASAIVRASSPEGGKRLIALSFDDGPSESNTPVLLDILASRGARATFFMVGSRAQSSIEVARAVVARGHEVGNHSHRHAHPSSMSLKELERDFDEAATALESITGRPPRMMRPPFGKRARELSAVARRKGATVALWSLDSGDAAGLGAVAVAKNVIEHVRAGDIVLMHDGGDVRPVTLEAASVILDELQLQGYEFVTISELLRAGCRIR